MMGVDLLPRPPSYTAPMATLRPFSNLGRKPFLRLSRGQLKMQTAPAPARLHPVSRCTAAGGSCEPDPDEDDRMDWAKKVREEIDRFGEEYAAKLGVSVEDSAINSKDMFSDEQQKIMDNLWDIFSSGSSDILHAGAKTISLDIHWTTAQALSLCSSVMESASSRLQHPTEISLNTIEQTVRIYTSIFVKVGEDTYNGKVNKGTVISLLGALEGLAAISHILLQDTVDGINYMLHENGSLTKYSPSQDVDALHSDYKKQMSGLKQNIIRTASAVEVCKVMDLIIRDAGTCTIIFILYMLCFRGEALAQAPGLNTRPTDADDRHPTAPEDN